MAKNQRDNRELSEIWTLLDDSVEKRFFNKVILNFFLIKSVTLSVFYQLQ